MSHKSPKIASIIRPLEGRGLDAHYLGFFECFNRQLFFEAHEVLEELWLGQRGQTNDLFYKGLIQLAGAFVHIQKQRPGPAVSLFNLARENLGKYPPVYEALNLVSVHSLIRTWQDWVKEQPANGSRVEPQTWPKINLVTDGQKLEPC